MIILSRERSIFLLYLPVNPSLSFFERIPCFLLFKRVVLCLYQSSPWQSFFKQKACSSSMIKVLGAHNTIEKWLSALESAFAFLFTKPSRSTGNYPLSSSLVINWIFFLLDQSERRRQRSTPQLDQWVLIGLLETPQLPQLSIGGASSIQYMTLRSIPQWSSKKIKQACKRSKKKVFNLAFPDLSSGQGYTLLFLSLFYSIPGDPVPLNTNLSFHLNIPWAYIRNHNYNKVGFEMK